jgi:5-methylcytosine-specific restriction endonuclease McrA
MNKNKARLLIKKGDAVCDCCGYHLNLTIDHIVPKSSGGKSNKENLRILCKPCNNLKGSKNITLAELQRLREGILTNAMKYGFDKKSLRLIQ